MSSPPIHWPTTLAPVRVPIAVSSSVWPASGLSGLTRSSATSRLRPSCWIPPTRGLMRAEARAASAAPRMCRGVKTAVAPASIIGRRWKGSSTSARMVPLKPSWRAERLRAAFSSSVPLAMIARAFSSRADRSAPSLKERWTIRTPLSNSRRATESSCSRISVGTSAPASSSRSVSTAGP